MDLSTEDIKMDTPRTRVTKLQGIPKTMPVDRMKIAIHQQDFMDMKHDDINNELMFKTGP